MKSFLIVLATLFCTVYSSEDVFLSKRAVTCDSILAVKVCNRFRDIGTQLKLKANEIENQITDAYTKGITKADEIKTKVEKFLQEKIISKKCEDLLEKAYCDKLDVVGSYLKKTGDQMKEYIAKAMIQGVVLGGQLKDKIEDYIRNDLMKKTCVDILPADKCQQIDDIGKALKLKAEQIKNATIESILRGYNKIQDTVMTTLTKMKKYAEAFTCEELLNPDVCKTLREYATKFKIGFPKMMNAVRSAIVMGYKVGKGFLTVVYKITDAFIDCEHFLSHENCEKIKATAHKIGVTATKVKDIIVEAVKKGITEAKDIYKTALEYLKNKFGRKRRSLVEKRDLKATLEKYREMVKKGIVKANEYLKKAISKTLDALKIADEKIREAVMKAIEDGKTKYEDLKQYIKELIAKKNGDISITKRSVSSLRDLLTKALGKATGIVKATIIGLLNMTNEQLQNIKRYVQGIVDMVLGENKRDLSDESLDSSVDFVAKEQLKNIQEEYLNEVDDVMSEIGEHVAYIMHDVTEQHKQKRQIDIDLSDLKIRDIIQSILKNHVGKAYEKLSKKTNELVASIKEALKKAGSSIIDVSKVVLQKINEMIEKLKSGPEF